MYSVYVLHSIPSDSIYIGMSSNLSRRFKEHNSGVNLSTKSGRPWVIIHEEKFGSRDKARLREKYLKSYRGRIKIRKMIETGGSIS